ncbi:hypothetical protein H0H92_013046 [Tricholoma furcatifolium]|nr:hypothetical protein H0H92_013046 [Tricholoma furcatifolium]
MGYPSVGDKKHTSVKSDKILDSLLENPSIQRICAFGSRVYELYSSRHYNYVKDTVETIRANRDGDDPARFLQKYDKKVGIFPCRSFNLGSHSISLPHIDEGNLASAFCSITAFGDFNPDKGGQIVLWDLKLVINFPPGSTIMIPSALLIHFNTPIQEHEK